MNLFLDKEVIEYFNNDIMGVKQYVVLLFNNIVLKEVDELFFVLENILGILESSIDLEREIDFERELKCVLEKVFVLKIVVDDVKDDELEVLCEIFNMIIEDNIGELFFENEDYSNRKEKCYNFW